MKKILDACCGGRMFWFNKTNPDVLFIDKRTMKRQVIWERGTEKRFFEVSPDVIMDFRKMDIADSVFSLVVFDPPHLAKRNGKTGWLQKKYGSLDRNNWQEDIRSGFSECFRVLKNDGILVFKWCEIEIPLKKILELTPNKPLFGHPSGKTQKTHWIVFMKGCVA